SRAGLRARRDELAARVQAALDEGGGSVARRYRVLQRFYPEMVALVDEVTGGAGAQSVPDGSRTGSVVHAGRFGSVSAGLAWARARYGWLAGINPGLAEGGEFGLNCVLAAIVADWSLGSGEEFQVGPSEAAPYQYLVNYAGGVRPVAVGGFAR